MCALLGKRARKAAGWPSHESQGRRTKLADSGTQQSSRRVGCSEELNHRETPRRAFPVQRALTHDDWTGPDLGCDTPVACGCEVHQAWAVVFRVLPKVQGLDVRFSFSDGHFVYIEGNEASPGDVARLLSPACAPSGPLCFRFWFHMYGVARTMALRVYVVSGGEAPELVWSKEGNWGDRWRSAEVSLAHRGRVQVKGRGSLGPSGTRECVGTPRPSVAMTGDAPLS